jgi:hypothetical protein
LSGCGNGCKDECCSEEDLFHCMGFKIVE